MPPAYTFGMWCLVGIAVCVLLQQIELLIKDVKAKGWAYGRMQPVETVEQASPVSLPTVSEDVALTGTPPQSHEGCGRRLVVNQGDSGLHCCKPSPSILTNSA